MLYRGALSSSWIKSLVSTNSANVLANSSASSLVLKRDITQSGQQSAESNGKIKNCLR